MAVGDIAYVTGDNPVVEGNKWRLLADIEVSNTYTAFDVCPDGYIYDCTLTCLDGAGSAEIDYNVNASGTEDNGSIAVAGNHPDTLTYRASILCVR